MNTRIDFFRDKQMIEEVDRMYINKQILNNQNELCDNLYTSWKICIDNYSWNDKNCIGKLKPEYELCIRKRNYMISKLDENNEDTD